MIICGTIALVRARVHFHLNLELLDLHSYEYDLRVVRGGSVEGERAKPVDRLTRFGLDEIHSTSAQKIEFRAIRRVLLPDC